MSVNFSKATIGLLSMLLLQALPVSHLTPEVGGCSAAFAAQAKKKSTGDSPAATTSPSPAKFALMVGINDYAAKKLNGAENDVHDLREVLCETFGFQNDEQHIVELIDKGATKKRIIESIRTHLIDNAKRHPDGLFVFQFSGHGIQIKDDAAHADEIDGMDEALIPIDVNGKVFENPDQLRSCLITDDELSLLLKELCKATKNVVVITDCCRSGTNLRAVGVVSRHMNMSDFGVKAEGKSEPATSREFLEDFDVDIPGDRYIAISGSDANHDAIEAPMKTSDVDDRYSGLMTRHLISLLKTSRSDITYRQLGDRLRSMVAADSAQNPQIEGDLDRYVFADHSQKADPFFSVIKFEKKTATVNAGASLGIKTGAVFSFYDESARRLRGKDRLLASGSVIAVEPFQCTVELEEGLAAEKITHAKAVVAAPEAATQMLPIVLDSSVKEAYSETFTEFARALEKATSSYTSIKVSTEPQDTKNAKYTTNTNDSKAGGWNIAICAGSLSEFRNAGGVCNVSSADTTPGLYLCRQTSQPIAYTWLPIEKSAAAEAENIVTKARLVTNQDTVRGIFNCTSELNGLVEATIWKAEKKGDCWEKAICISNSKETPHLKPEDRLIVSVKNNSAVPLYISMLSLGTSGKIEPLYPPAEGEDAPLPAGMSKDLKRCRIALPVGHETYKLVASTSPVNLTLLRQDSLTRGETVRSGTTIPSAQLQDIIMRAAGAQTRGNEPPITDFDQDWTSMDLNFVIEAN